MTGNVSVGTLLKGGDLVYINKRISPGTVFNLLVTNGLVITVR